MATFQTKKRQSEQIESCQISSVAVDDEFVAGVLIDAGSDAFRFLPGQLFGLADQDDPIDFVAGQMEDGTINFVPGQAAQNIFYPGKVKRPQLPLPLDFHAKYLNWP